MVLIGIVYYCNNCEIHEIANLIAEGVIGFGNTRVKHFRLTEKDFQSNRFCAQWTFSELAKCDAIIFGSPASENPTTERLLAFADASYEQWQVQRWVGKLAAGFTCGTIQHCQQISTLQHLITLASSHGMLWVTPDVPPSCSNSDYALSCKMGIVIQIQSKGVINSEMNAARNLGYLVAKYASRFRMSDEKVLGLHHIKYSM